MSGRDLVHCHPWSSCGGQTSIADRATSRSSSKPNEEIVQYNRIVAHGGCSNIPIRFLFVIVFSRAKRFRTSTLAGFLEKAPAPSLRRGIASYSPLLHETATTTALVRRTSRLLREADGWYFQPLSSTLGLEFSASTENEIAVVVYPSLEPILHIAAPEPSRYCV